MLLLGESTTSLWSVFSPCLWSGMDSHGFIKGPMLPFADMNMLQFNIFPCTSIYECPHYLMLVAGERPDVARPIGHGPPFANTSPGKKKRHVSSSEIDSLLKPAGNTKKSLKRKWKREHNRSLLDESFRMKPLHVQTLCEGSYLCHIFLGVSLNGAPKKCLNRSLPYFPQPTSLVSSLLDMFFF